tara:strand:+ start:32287 stop:32982 length:696 start_codon:yes stop_codon:yes gene_type:complete
MTACRESLRIMPREMRMMSERILSLTNLPKGFALMVGDVIMYSEAMGLGGFALLEQRLEALLPADPTAISLAGGVARELVLDAGGQHAWFVVASVLDLLDEALESGKTAAIKVTNCMDPAELAIAAALGRRVGLEVVMDGSILSASAAGKPADPVLDAVLAEGCAIAADLWWRIYDLAKTALTPESAVSRRHAGPIIVTEDGQIIGRVDNDDDTDLQFISKISNGSQEARS